MVRGIFPFVHSLCKTVMYRIIVDVMDEVQKIFQRSDFYTLKRLVEQTSSAMLLFVECLRVRVEEV